MRRVTRSTKGLRLKAENLYYAASLHSLCDNFCRPYKNLKGQTPAMAAALTNHVWELLEAVARIEAFEWELVKNVKSQESK